MNRADIVVARARHDRPNDMLKEHFHDRFEIYYLVAGERLYFVDHQTYYLQPGDLIFIDRYALHKTQDTGLGRHERILLEFTSSFMSPLEPDLAELLSLLFRKGGRLLRLRTPHRDKVEQLLFEVLRESDDAPYQYEFHIRLLLSQLLITVARLIKNDLDQREHRATEAYYHPVVHDVIRHINLHYLQSALSLDDISDTYKISKSYLCRLFKQYSGYTFIEYVNLLKIREAQKLLRETRDAIIDVSEQAGFGNVHHFCRVFRQVSHCSPREYRKNHRSFDSLHHDRAKQ